MSLSAVINPQPVRYDGGNSSLSEADSGSGRFDPSKTRWTTVSYRGLFPIQDDAPRTYAWGPIVSCIGPAQRLRGLFLAFFARLVNGTQRVPEDPIRDAAALRSGDNVRVAVVDADVHARVDDLPLRLR